jgi:uncharacterized protein (DUF433 family)
MTWHERITSDHAILAGKPIVRGTRLAVDFILSLFAEGWTEEEVLSNYPRLTTADVRAVFAFAAEMAADESVHVMSRHSA